MGKRKGAGRPKGDEKDQVNMTIRKKKIPVLKKLAIDRGEAVGETVEFALKETFNI